MKIKHFLIILISFCIVYITIIPKALSDNARDIALLLKITGSVEINKANPGGWQKGVRGMRLNSGDKIRTGDNSMATVIFTDDKSLLKIRSASEVTLSGERENRTITKKLTMEIGQMWAKVQQGGGGFQMETPSGVAAVKGTEWYGLVFEDGTSTFIVLDGIVELLNQFGQDMVEAGQTGTMSKETAPLIEETGEFEDWANIGEGEGDVEEIKLYFEDADGNQKVLRIKYKKSEGQ